MTIRPSAAAMLLTLVSTAILPGCIHLKGDVLTDPTNRPLTTAKLSIGRPDGIGVFATYDVNRQGQFDFYISPTDLNAVYVYDSTAMPELTMRRLDRSEIN